MTNVTTDPRDNLSQDEVLLQWQLSKDILANAKEAEMEWRKYVVKRAFPDAKEGTNKQELGNGYELKAVVKYNYRLLDNDTVEKCIERIASTGNRGVFIAERLVSWTPNFLLTEYRELDKEQDKEILKIVHEMLEITDAAPTVEIKAPPKGKK